MDSKVEVGTYTHHPGQQARLSLDHELVV